MVYSLARTAKLLDAVWSQHVEAVEQIAQGLSREEALTLVRLTAQVRRAPEP